MVIEAKVAPQDINNVRQGQPANIRFTAFHQRTTPKFQGVVTRVSADLSKDAQTGASYYVVRLTLGDAGESRTRELTLVPGMPAEVYIRTGERTAMSYFLNPLSDQFARAFIER